MGFSSVDSHEEFVDVCEPYSGKFSKGAPVYPTSHEEFVDVCQSAETDFTVVLNDRLTITVRGRSIRMLGGNGTDTPTTFAINRWSGSEEITVAVFRASEVAGIFSGQMNLLARTA